MRRKPHQGGRALWGLLLLGTAFVLVSAACSSDNGNGGAGTGGIAGYGASAAGGTGAVGGGTGGAGGTGGTGGAGGTGGTGAAGGAGGSGGAGGAGGSGGAGGGADAGGAGGTGGAGGGADAGGAGGGADAGGDGGMGGVVDGGTSDGGGFGGAGGAAGASGAGGTGGSGLNADCEVTAVPDDIRATYSLAQSYQKYVDANGIPVVSSSNPQDAALLTICEQLYEMLRKRDDVRQELVRNRFRISLIAQTEELSDVPEINALYGTSLNWRARGLGGNPTVCAEENVLCLSGDRWTGENICIHEFGHSFEGYGLSRIDPTFGTRLREAYNAAIASGNFANTYAAESASEFWAEGVQDWYNTNLESVPANGVHNSIDTQEELRDASPELYQLLGEAFYEDSLYDDCYAD